MSSARGSGGIMAQRQCECGFRYNETDPGDSARHAERHDEWLKGAQFPPMPDEVRIARLADIEVVLVTNASPQEARERAARVASRARLDTPFPAPAYTVADAHPDSRVFIGRRGDRAVALAVLRPEPRWGWWSWDDYDEERRPATPVAPLTTWTVESIWTLPNAQQRGLAHQLLEVASRTVDQPIASFGWRRPFTPSGEAFVRRLCPEGFWIPD